jgi:hypothetical protein
MNCEALTITVKVYLYKGITGLLLNPKIWKSETAK